MLNKIRDALGIWRTELDKLESSLEQKLQRLSFLQEAPLPPAEIADSVIAVMLRHAESSFHNCLDIKLRNAICKPLEDVDETSWRPALLSRFNDPQSADPWALLWVLRSTITETIRSEIIAWDGMPESGPPKAERVVEIAALESDIARLRERIEVERQAARDAGLDLASIHTRDQVPKRPRDLPR